MNYFLASFLGFIPSFFIYSTLGAGLNSYVKQAQTFSLIEFVLQENLSTHFNVFSFNYFIVHNKK